MNTKESKSDSLQDFCKELKKTVNCSDMEVAKFLEFLDKPDQLIERDESSGTSF